MRPNARRAEEFADDADFDDTLERKINSLYRPSQGKVAEGEIEVLLRDIPEDCKAGGYCNPAKQIFFCTPCKLKWSSVKFQSGGQMRVKQLAQRFEEASAPQRIETIPSAEEDNKVIGLDAISPQEMRSQLETKFLQKFIAPRCFERIHHIEDLIKYNDQPDEYDEDYVDEVFNRMEKPATGLKLLSYDLQLVQFKGEYRPILTTASLQYAENNQAIVSRLLFVFGKQNTNVEKKILLEQLKFDQLTQTPAQGCSAYLRFRFALFYWKRSRVEEKQIMQLTKINLRTCVETKVEGFEFEEELADPSLIHFDKRFGTGFVMYWKQIGGIHRKVHQLEDKGIEEAKRLSSFTGITAILVIDSSTYKISWRFLENSEEDEKQLIERAIEEGNLLEDDTGECSGDAIEPWELFLLKRRTIIIQNGAEVAIYELGNLVDPLRSLDIEKDREVTAFYVLDTHERDGNKKEDLMRTFIFWEGVSLYHVDYFPHDEKRNKVLNLSQSLSRIKASLAKTDISSNSQTKEIEPISDNPLLKEPEELDLTEFREPEAKETNKPKFEKLDALTRYYTLPFRTDRSSGHLDVQRQEITVKLPNQKEEKTFTQFFLYSNRQVLLLYPCYDPDVGSDVFGNLMSVLTAAGGGRADIRKNLIYFHIVHIIEQKVSNNLGVIRPLFLKHINNSTDHLRNHQLFPRLDFSSALEGIVKSRQIPSCFKSNQTANQIWLRTSEFESTLMATILVNEEPYFFTLTFSSQNEMAHILHEADQNLGQLRVEKKGYAQIIDRLSKDGLEDLGLFSEPQAQIMKHALSQGLKDESFSLNSTYSNMVSTGGSVHSTVSELPGLKLVFSEAGAKLQQKEGGLAWIIVESVSQPGNYSRILLGIEELKVKMKPPSRNPSEVIDRQNTEPIEVLQPPQWTIEMKSYMRSEENFIFLFRLLVDQNQALFFFVKPVDDIETLENRKDLCLFAEDSSIFILQPFQKFAEAKFSTKSFRLKEFISEVLSSPPEFHLWKQDLKVEKLRDMKIQSSFFPVLHRDEEDNRALIFIAFDAKNQLYYTSINPVHLDSSYSKWEDIQICRSSTAIYAREDKSNSCTKYQIAFHYPGMMSRIHIKEFALVQDFKANSTNLLQTGIREILPSQPLFDSASFTSSYCVLPYFGAGGIIEGTQFFIYQPDNLEYRSFVVYDEQFNRSQLIYKSDHVKLGHQKVFIDELNSSKFFLLLSSCMRSRFIYSKFFDIHETRALLENTTCGMLKMVPFSFESLIKDVAANSGFFQTYESIGGKSQLDFRMKHQKLIIQAFSEEKIQPLSDANTLVRQLMGRDQRSFITFIGTLQKTGFPMLTSQGMSTDFNFISPLERAYQLRATKISNTLLENMLASKESWRYKPLIMRVLPLAMKLSKASSFHSFLETPEGMLQGEKTCTMESKLVSPQLPQFSNIASQMLRLADYYDFNNPYSELISLIKQSLESSDTEKPLQIDVQEHEDDNQGQGAFQLEHIYFDLRQLILGEKIRSKKRVKFDSYYLSKLINEANEDLFELASIRKIIDMQFYTTRTIALAALILYLVLFIIPFTLTILEEGTVVQYYVIGLIPQTFFFIVELVQLRQERLDYFRRDYWNFFDFIQFPNYMVLLYFEISLTQFDKGTVGYTRIEFVIILARLALIIETFIKVLYFIRIFESFGFLVQMVFLTMREVFPFTVFMFMWVALFTLCYIILHVEIGNQPIEGEEVDYLYINKPVRFMIQSYRNSIGDINAPDYGEWAPSEGDDPLSGIKYTIIYLVWFVWFINQFVNLIILLNFLIAVISESYEKVISQQRTHNNLHKSQLNEEIYQMGRFFRIQKPFKVLALSSDKELYKIDKNEWEGLIKTIHKEIVTSVSKLTQQVTDEVRTEMKKTKDELQKEMAEMRSDLREILRSIQGKGATEASAQEQAS